MNGSGQPHGINLISFKFKLNPLCSLSSQGSLIKGKWKKRGISIIACTSILRRISLFHYFMRNTHENHAISSPRPQIYSTINVPFSGSRVPRAFSLFVRSSSVISKWKYCCFKQMYICVWVHTPVHVCVHAHVQGQSRDVFFLSQHSHEKTGQLLSLPIHGQKDRQASATHDDISISSTPASPFAEYQ